MQHSNSQKFNAPVLSFTRTIGAFEKKSFIPYIHRRAIGEILNYYIHNFVFVKKSRT